MRSDWWWCRQYIVDRSIRKRTVTVGRHGVSCEPVAICRVICYHVPSGRWLLRARNRSSSRVLFRDILFRISLYKSWTPAEVHGTRPPCRSSELQMELCFYLSCESYSTIAHSKSHFICQNAVSNRGGFYSSLYLLVLFILSDCFSYELILYVEETIPGYIDAVVGD